MTIREAQLQVRTRFVGGFYGQLVAGVLWLTSAGLAVWRGPRASIMMLTNPIVLGVAAWVLLAGSIVSVAQQTGELTGIRGIPVDGHDIVAGIEIVGTKHIDRPRLRERLRLDGAELRLGWPLESETLCRFKEVLRDLLAEKGFTDAEVTHETRPTYGNRRHLTLEFTINEGKRGRPIRASAYLSPAQRCLR